MFGMCCLISDFTNIIKGLFNNYVTLSCLHAKSHLQLTLNVFRRLTGSRGEPTVLVWMEPRGAGGARMDGAEGSRRCSYGWSRGEPTVLVWMEPRGADGARMDGAEGSRRCSYGWSRGEPTVLVWMEPRGADGARMDLIGTGTHGSPRRGPPNFAMLRNNWNGANDAQNKRFVYSWIWLVYHIDIVESDWCIILI